MENNKRQICAGCEHCKIWYDEKEYTMRLSCNATSKHGKTITWKCYPTYTYQAGNMVQTSDTIESITNEFEDYAKRRLSPTWCKYRKDSK